MDKYGEFFEKVGKRLDLVLLGAGAVLLLLAIYLLNREQQYVVPAPEQPRRLDWTVSIPLGLEEIPEPEEEQAERIERLRRQYIRTEESIEADDRARILVDVNPFSESSVREGSQAAEAIMRDFREADRLFREGNLDGAEQLVDSILARSPRHEQTLRLQQRIAERREAAGEED